MSPDPDLPSANNTGVSQASCTAASQVSGTAVSLMEQLMRVTMEEETLHNKVKDTQEAIGALQQLLQDTQQQLARRQQLYTQLQADSEHLRRTRIDLIRRKLLLLILL